MSYLQSAAPFGNSKPYAYSKVPQHTWVIYSLYSLIYNLDQHNNNKMPFKKYLNLTFSLNKSPAKLPTPESSQSQLQQHALSTFLNFRGFFVYLNLHRHPSGYGCVSCCPSLVSQPPVWLFTSAFQMRNSGLTNVRTKCGHTSSHASNIHNDLS